MAIGPNKNNNNNSENNENSPLSPGDIRRAVHISPPLPGRQSFLLDPTSRRAHEDMMQRIVSEEIQVREELGEMSHYNLHPPSLLLPDQNIQAPYQLQFINKVQDPTFTTDLVRDEIGVPIKVAIFDTSTQSIIPPNSILSSSKVRIMVVDAEYWKNRVNWSISEFLENVLSEREGKRPILTGHSLIIQLKNGVGTFENIVFNDNSSWTKNGFRLAVMVKGGREEGYFNGERVQEGVSERFRVKDRRGKETKKPDRLELTHSVRLINQIGKDRASCLENKNINTVEDFLKLYYNDEPALREILGIKSQSGKAWESMVKHVIQCDGEYQNKCIASNTSSQPQQDCVIVPHLEKNLFLSTNGLGLSKPNPSDSYIIEGDVSAIKRQHVPTSNFSLMNLPNQPISAGRMVQYTWERHNAGGDSGNYSGIDGGTYGNGGNYSGGGIDGGTYGGGGSIGIGNYGGGGIGIGNYGGGGGIGNYGGGSGSGGIGIGNYGGGGGIGIGNYGGGGGIGIGNYGGSGGGIGIGNYSGGRGIDIGNYGGGGIGIGNYGGGIGIGIGNYGGGIGIGNYGGGIGIGNYGGGGIGIGNYGGGGGIGIVNYGAGGGIGNYSSGGGSIGIGNYSGGGIGIGIGNYGGSGEIGIDNNGGGGIGNYGGGGGIGIGNDNYGSGGIGVGNYGGGGGNGGIGNYVGGGIGIGNYGSGGGIGIGIGNYSGGGGIGNDGGTGGGYYSGNYCGGGNSTYGRDGGGIDSDTYGSCGGGIDNYGDGGNGGGNVNYCGGGGGGDWFGSSFTGREGSMAVSGLEGLSLEGSQT